MKKIISLFKRNYAAHRFGLVYNEVTPGAEWVQAGEGRPTRKLDGTCCRILDGVLWKRRTVKRGKAAPPGFEAATEIDSKTGKQEGWVRVDAGPEDERHRQALARSAELFHLEDATYELVGPGVQGNPENLNSLRLYRHGAQIWARMSEPPRDFAGLRDWFQGRDIEGIVWHHPDGRMVKIKKRDFGLRRQD